MTEDNTKNLIMITKFHKTNQKREYRANLEFSICCEIFLKCLKKVVYFIIFYSIPLNLTKLRLIHKSVADPW